MSVVAAIARTDAGFSRAFASALLAQAADDCPQLNRAQSGAWVAAGRTVLRRRTDPLRRARLESRACGLDLRDRRPRPVCARCREQAVLGLWQGSAVAISSRAPRCSWTRRTRRAARYDTRCPHRRRASCRRRGMARFYSLGAAAATTPDVADRGRWRRKAMASTARRARRARRPRYDAYRRRRCARLVALLRGSAAT